VTAGTGPVAVTGASGRIGGAVVALLLRQGRQVVGIDPGAARLSAPGYRHVQAGADRREAVADALAGASAVLHLGAFMSWLPRDSDRLFAANVEATRILLEEAVRAGTGRFVFASSGEVYPENSPETLPVTEEHPLRPRSVYGLTKLVGEELVRFHGRSSGLSFTILRFSHTQDAAELLDPDSFFSGPRFFLHTRIRQQEALGNKAAVAALNAADDGSPALVLARNQDGRPFRMHITETRDMAEGVLLALAAPAAAGRTYNLGATEPVDFARALPLMAAATGLPLRVVDLPGPGVFYETSNARIREELGFRPQWTIDRMIAEAAAAWRTRRAS
jgi:UDP-glucose 4-epimerase